MITKRPLLFILTLTLTVTATWNLGRAGYIQAKAMLAQHLIASAWDETLANPNQPLIHPWSWADTGPVARLQVPSLGVDQLVLDSSSGQALAFGPGLLTGFSSSDTNNHDTIISGHRDTHFRFMQNIQPGIKVALQNPQGEWLHYKVSATQVIDIRTTPLLAQNGGGLILITCYPFSTLTAGGPLRYVAMLTPETGTL